MLSAYDLKQRRDKAAAAIDYLNELEPEQSCTRDELFDVSDSATIKGWSRGVLRMLQDLYYINRLGKGNRVTYRRIQEIEATSALLSACVSPRLNSHKTPSEIVEVEGGEVEDGEVEDGEVEDGDKTEVVAPMPEIDPDDPEGAALALLALLPGVSVAVHRIQKRMTTVEHRLMALQEKVDELHASWTDTDK